MHNESFHGTYSVIHKWWVRDHCDMNTLERVVVSENKWNIISTHFAKLILIFQINLKTDMFSVSYAIIVHQH